ncbi:hypothetical protein [Sodalis sp. dw_96]|uniref:hypothetical protein n=1 Tax=Sodalis sp. dw_96 TaxID=2719794 RepID=UPI001BD63B0E|nr:hypothetical protein [Sodalis sp. dw_96]
MLSIRRKRFLETLYSKSEGQAGLLPVETYSIQRVIRGDGCFLQQSVIVRVAEVDGVINLRVGVQSVDPQVLANPGFADRVDRGH